jgi:hypothetical protein
MLVSLIHAHYDRDHLESVKKEMEKMGAPKIKAIYVECHDIVMALEGCHRIRACKELGLVPEFDFLDYDTVCNLDVTDKSLGLDVDMPGTTIENLVDDCHRRELIAFID